MNPSKSLKFLGAQAGSKLHNIQEGQTSLPLTASKFRKQTPRKLSP